MMAERRRRADWAGGARMKESGAQERRRKTGPRTVPLGEAARAQIDLLPGKRRPDAFLFPKLGGGRYSHSLVVCWRAVCADAKLGRLRLHDLRHTAASQAVISGENLPLVGKLLGHRRHRTTASYAHLADGHLVEAAEKIGTVIAGAMDSCSNDKTAPSTVRRSALEVTAPERTPCDQLT